MNDDYSLADWINAIFLRLLGCALAAEGIVEVVWNFGSWLWSCL
jgi:hypothetical protein